MNKIRLTRRTETIVALTGTVLCTILSGCNSQDLTAGQAQAAPGIGLTQVSFDPYTNSDGQHETAMETNIMSQGSTLIAGYHIARLEGGGVTNIGWAVSNDAGNTWQHHALANTTTYAGGSLSYITDPVVAYDAKHSTWMISYSGGGGSQNAIRVSLSTDHGNTFGNPIVVASGPEPDKNWTTCDNSAQSPHYGTCYTEYDDNISGVVYMSRSTDGGKTWEASKTTTDQLQGIAGQPVVMPNGRVVVPISNMEFSQFYVFTSDDGGSSWSASQPIQTPQTAPARAGLRQDPNPSVTVDASGKLYMTWYDCRFENQCDANGLVLSTSTDGTSWSTPTRINTFPVNASLSHIFPGIGADPSTNGKLGLVFYTVSAGACLTDETACQIDAYYSSSTDSGNTWATPTHLAGPMQPQWISTTARGRLIGDYTGMAFSNGVAFPTFSVALQPTTLPYRQGVYTFPQLK
jgi:Neuraminidase (sialidase)